MKMDTGESRGARLLREFERVYRTLSLEQQRSVLDAMRDACERLVETPEPRLGDSAAGAA
jgi:hypothetical protein